MKKNIIITSIFSPTEAVKEFSNIKDHKLIVIGDKKTPLEWHCENVDFISVDSQKRLNYKIIKGLPYNHYCRKMIGYLIAIENGADFIIDTDDDNIPQKGWGFPCGLDEEYDYIEKNKGFINIYQLYTNQKIWPRGLPLNLISKNFELEKYITKKKCKVGIWQGLADEDPDVDAIYRMTSDEICYFNKRNPIIMGQGTISPFNTQNTMITKELFSLLYLPTYVTFRFTDILRGLIAQPIMWLYGYHLGFINATVIQKRNPHDYMKDFISEVPMYQHVENVINIIQLSISKNESIESNLYNSYNALLKEKIVLKEEMKTLENWLIDVQNLLKN